jgi:hypothetical protein
VIARDLGLELPRRKPLGVPRINPQHPLARGLTFATLMTGDGVPRDLVLGRAASPSGAPTAIRNTPQGQALLFNGSTDNCNFGDIASYRTGSQVFTIAAYANPPASSTTFGLASKRNGSSFVQVSFAANMDNNGGPVSGLLGLFMLDGSNQLSGATTSSPINGAFHQFVATRNSATTLQFYVDAVSQPLNYTSQANANYNATDPLFIGAMGSTSAPAGGYLPGSIGYVYIWRGRVLTASEIAWLYRDPYAMVREAPRQEPYFTIWQSTGGGGGTTYTLSGSATQTQTLSLRRAPNLVRQIAQTQTLVLPKQVRLVRANTQTQALSIVAQRVFLRTVSATQAQVLALSTAVHHTFALTVSAVQAQVLSLLAQLSVSPPPNPVVVPSTTPPAGVAVSNYLDWPQHTITSSDIPPPVGSAVGGP